jgi:acyl-CoA thioester hydrolase
MGVAHHGAYVIWIEAARVEWLRERGKSYRELEDSGVSLAVSGLVVRYRQAARFDDELEVQTWLGEARGRRVRFLYRIHRTNDGALLATAETEHVPTDRRGRAIRMPEPWLEVLRANVEAPAQAL